MATYLILNIVVLCLVAGAAYLSPTSYTLLPVVITMVILLVLTAIFDNLIVASGIVAYDRSLISGLRLIRMPVEDFAYAIAVVLLVPLLWKLSKKR